jgi:hypothetical protein
MASKRELIVSNVVDSINAINSVKMGKVTREPAFRNETEFYALARTNFPHIIVTSGNESREDITMGSSSLRGATLTIDLICFIKSSDKSADESMNDLIEAIEEKLDIDRSRDGNAINTEVREVVMGAPIEHPYGSCTVSVEIDYTFTRGIL